jgi:hypothetical protein
MTEIDTTQGGHSPMEEEINEKTNGEEEEVLPETNEFDADKFLHFKSCGGTLTPVRRLIVSLLEASKWRSTIPLL